VRRQAAARELQRRLEEHRAGAAVRPRPARLAHTDVWIRGWFVEPRARQSLFAATSQEHD